MYVSVSSPVLLRVRARVKGTCDNQRNLSDDQLKRIAQTGGVIGIGYWETAVCGKDATAIAKAIRYTANLVGVDHVGLGSDFDGVPILPQEIDSAADLPKITQALLDRGYKADDIKKILGGNLLRVFREVERVSREMSGRQ